jgi:hypothetical protein
MTKRFVLAVVFFGLGVSSAFGAAVVYSASGADGVAIFLPAVLPFQTALGTLNPNNVGSFPSGRREISWDGVPDSQAAPNNLPADFFNVISPRGVVFSTPGVGFQVSSSPISGVPLRFGNINAAYTAIFQTFTSPRLFTSLNSNVLDVNFRVPGFVTPATTSGFGAVFTDVDASNVTSIQFFDAVGNGLGIFFVPVAPNGGLSFLGVLFNAGERVGRVRITSGNASLSPATNDPPADVVVMDDFIYGEPQGIVTPTPTATPTTPPPISTPTPTATFAPTTPTATPTPTATFAPPTPTATPTPTVTLAPPTPTATPTPTVTFTQTAPAATSTATATPTNTPPLVATATATATSTATSTPVATVTATATIVGGGGGPSREGIPTLSGGMLALLAVTLAAIALLLVRRG